MSDVGRVLALAGVVGLVVVNSVAAARRLRLDDDAPLLGRAATGLMLGLPLALAETVGLAALWLAIGGR